MALIPQDLAAISKLLETQEQRLERKIETAKQEVLDQMTQDREDVASLFHKTWELIDENKKEANQRLIILEEHTGIHHKN